MAIRGLAFFHSHSLFLIRVSVFRAFLLFVFFLLFFLHRLLDGLDEVGGFLVVGELGGEIVGVLSLGVVESGAALIGIIEIAPNDLHAGLFWCSSARFLCPLFSLARL